MSAVIKTREILTAKLTNTGAIRSFISSFGVNQEGRISFQNTPSKTLINTIKGEVAIASQSTPILAKRTITNAKSGSTSKTQNPTLITLKIKDCQFHRSSYPLISAKWNTLEYKETKGHVIDFPLLIILEIVNSALL